MGKYYLPDVTILRSRLLHLVVGMHLCTHKPQILNESAMRNGALYQGLDFTISADLCQVQCSLSILVSNSEGSTSSHQYGRDLRKPQLASNMQNRIAGLL